ncbi:hypothetical protein [Flavisolibacter ginsenosidimutans]|uniref:Uncharacterized protein n=1 Tax=Flavisolibacter ginsenosidimutans TaxID=661481 RepID=A0A5B8UJX5_9BACT|nr:hypothetical protein [Flavisolibacter ginsenosidimutans]QEC56702.1 hypothetical protein FSB75_12605 [Flavisolibacter ginsenosidimutans]
MELVPIFVGTNSDDGGLWAIQYNEETDEFERLFDLWANVEYLESFFREHIHDLAATSWTNDTDELIEETVFSLLDEAEELEDALIYYVKGGLAGNGLALQQLFKPLDNRIYELKPLQKSKASIRTRQRPNPKLRIYAIRLAPNLYIVTGGAIKLTHTMNERPHLVAELQKIERVREWLKSEGISEPEDLNNEE